MCDHQNIIYVNDHQTSEEKRCNDCGFIIKEGKCKCSTRGCRGPVPYCLNCKFYLC
jgi:hypothetical protein